MCTVNDNIRIVFQRTIDALQAKIDILNIDITNIDNFITDCSAANNALQSYGNSLQLVGNYASNIVIQNGEPIDGGQCLSYSKELAGSTECLTTSITEATASKDAKTNLIEDYTKSINNLTDKINSLPANCGTCSECCPLDDSKYFGLYFKK